MLWVCPATVLIGGPPRKAPPANVHVPTDVRWGRTLRHTARAQYHRILAVLKGIVQHISYSYQTTDRFAQHKRLGMLSNVITT